VSVDAAVRGMVKPTIMSDTDHILLRASHQQHNIIGRRQRHSSATFVIALRAQMSSHNNQSVFQHVNITSNWSCKAAAISKSSTFY